MAPRSTDASISELRQQVKDFGGHIERAERQIAEVEAQLALERKRDGRRDALELEATRLYIGKLENELVVVVRMRLVCHAHTRLWWVAGPGRTLEDGAAEAQAHAPPAAEFRRARAGARATALLVKAEALQQLRGVCALVALRHLVELRADLGASNGMHGRRCQQGPSLGHQS